MNAFDSHFFVMEYGIEKENEKSYILSFERSSFMSSMFHSCQKAN